MRKTFFSCVFLLSCAGLTIAADQTDVVKDSLGKLQNAKTVSARIAVIDDLGALGAAASPAAELLTKYLAAEDAQVRWHAARALASIGPEAHASARALSDALRDEDPKVRAYSALALGKIGADPKSIIPQLVKAAGDRDEMVRRAAIQSLRLVRATGDELLEVTLNALENSDPQTIVLALQTIAAEGEAALPRLCEALQHPKAAYWACQVIQRMGPKAAPAADCLVQLLDREEPELQMAALMALGEIGKGASDARPKITEMLSSQQPASVRYTATFALAKIGLDPAADKALAENVRNGDDFLKMLSGWALARHHADDSQLVKQGIDLVVAGLKSSDEKLRSASARALRDFEAHRETVIPALVGALKDESAEVAGNAIDGLASLGAPAAQAAAKQLGEKQQRFLAIRVIQRIGKDSAATVPGLLRVLQVAPKDEEDEAFRREVQLALAAIGPAAAPAVPQLIESLSSQDVEIQSSAAYALGKIGPEAAKAAPLLREKTASEEELVKRVSLWALLKILPEDREIRQRAIPLLVQALSSERELARLEAAISLGDLGVKTKPVLAKLQELAEHDESPAVRQAAAESLQRLAK